MEIVWLRDPNSITELHTEPFQLSSIDGFGTVFIFCYRLDLLVVVSLFLSAFSLFYDVYTCVRLSLLPSLFVKQIYFFVLRFMFALFFLFVSFRFLHCLALATLSLKNNFLWWVVNHCPLFLYLAVLFSIHSIFLLSKFSKLVDNSSPRIELYLKNIHSICILQTTAIRHRQSQTPRLDWSSLSRLRFVITFSPASLLVIPFLVSAPPIHQSPFAPLPPLFRPLVLRSSLLYAIHFYSSRSGSSVPRPWSLSLFSLFLIIYHTSVILCLRTRCAALFVLDMHVLLENQ